MIKVAVHAIKNGLEKSVICSTQGPVSRREDGFTFTPLTGMPTPFIDILSNGERDLWQSFHPISMPPNPDYSRSANQSRLFPLNLRESHFGFTVS